MEQYMYVQLDSGEVVQVPEGSEDGTFVVQSDENAGTYIVQDGTDADSAGTAQSVAVTQDEKESDQVYYIVQQEGLDLEGMQFAIIGDEEAGSQQTLADASGAEIPNTVITVSPIATNVESASQNAFHSVAGSSVDMHEKIPAIQGASIQEGDESNEKNRIDSESNELSVFCEICGEAFSMIEQWQQHLEEKHGITEAEEEDKNITLLPTCAVCSQTFQTEKELAVHRKKHVKIVRIVASAKETEQKYRSTTCSEKLGSREEVEEKYNEKKVQPVNDKINAFTKCPYCHKMYIQRGNNKSLINHIYTAHPGREVESLIKDPVEEKMKCVFCDLEFVWTKSVIRHMKAYHPVEFEQQEDLILRTLGLMNAKASAKRYRRSAKDYDENDSDLLLCPHCPRQFIWEKSLKRHVTECHDPSEDPVFVKRRRRKKSESAVVFRCPHCELISKYACAVRKHLERKHPGKVKGINVNKMEIPTMEAKDVVEKLKTVDKRPIEERSDFFRVIYRCPFCSYASNQGSNLVRHLTSIKHGYIFSMEEIREIKISSFKVKPKHVDDSDKVDGSVKKGLPKLKLKGKVLAMVMQKYETLKRTKKEDKENKECDEEDYTNMDIENIIQMAENESDESFDEDEGDDDDDFKYTPRMSTRRQKARQQVVDKGSQQTRKENDSTLEGACDIPIDEDEIEVVRREGVADETSDSSKDDSNAELQELSRSCAAATDEKKRPRAKELSAQKSVIDQATLTNTGKDQNKNTQDESVLICAACKKAFTEFIEFKSHLPAHSNLKVEFNCRNCQKKYLRWKDFQKHTEESHGLKYTNPEIDMVSIKEMKMSSKPVTTFDCPYCEMLFSQSSSLQQHIIADHPNFIHSVQIKQERESLPRSHSSTSVVSAFLCQFCECIYNEVTDIIKHMHAIHRDVDKAELEKADSGIRKSGRKRKVPKWLEDEVDEKSSPKRSKASGRLKKEKLILNTSTENDDTGEDAASKETVMKNKVSPKKKPAESGTKAAADINKKGGEKEDEESDKIDTAISEGSSTSTKESSVVKTVSPNRFKKVTKRADVDQVNLKSSVSSCTVAGSTEVKKCPHCDYIAKRSSALAFHINFKHSDVKVKVEPEDSEDFVRKTDQTKGTKDLESSKIETTAEFRSSDVACKEPQNKNKKKAGVKEQDKLRSDDREVEDVINSLKNEAETDFDVDEEFDMENEEPEYGDSDDDYRPGNDDEEEDGDSDLEEDVDDGIEGFTLSGITDCPYCSESFEILTELERHVEEKHPDKSETFSLADLQTRVALDGTQKSVSDLHSCTCTLCKKMFSHKSMLKKHMKLLHGKKLRPIQRPHIKNDIETDEPNESKVYYKCPFCEVLAITEEEIRSHISGKHEIHNVEICMIHLSENERAATKYKCPFCDTRSSWRSCLMRHVSRAHPEENSFQRHQVVREILLEEKKNDSKNMFQCPYCTWQSDWKKEVLCHMEDVHSSKPVDEASVVSVDIATSVEDCFQCPFCELKSKYKRCVVRHVGRSHKDKKGFKPKDVIVLSRKGGKNMTVLQGRVYRCPYCQIESHWKHCIVEHLMRVHPQGDKTSIVDYDLSQGVNVNLDNMIFEKDEEILKYFGCSQCEMLSESATVIAEHVTEAHDDTISVKIGSLRCVDLDSMDIKDLNLAYKCPLENCRCYSRSMKKVVQHIKVFHPLLDCFQITLFDTGGEEQSFMLCKLCKEICHTEEEVNNHVREVHEGEGEVVFETTSDQSYMYTNIFFCPYCDFKSNFRRTVVTHVQKHHPHISNFHVRLINCELSKTLDNEKTGGFMCPYCDTVNHWKKSIIRHMRTMHPTRPCNIDVQFNPNLSVKTNSKAARKSSKQINCLRCGITCRSMGKMKKHFETQHPLHAKQYLSKENTEFSYSSLNTRPLEHVCVLCNARYMWRKSLLLHMKTQHRDLYDVYQTLEQIVNIISTNAGDDFTEEATSGRPVTENQFETAGVTTLMKKPDTQVTASSQMKCKKCQKSLGTTWALRVHDRLVHQRKLGKRYPCGKCRKTFPTKLLCNQHRARAHKIQADLLHCSVAGCNFKCHYNHRMKTHYVTAHSIQQPVSWKLKQSTNTRGIITCEICSITFTNPRVFAQHLVVHKKQAKQRYECGFCGKQFMSRGFRDYHIEFNHQDKTEMCDICGALCPKNRMAQHFKSHENDLSTRVVECPYCQRLVSEKVLSRHAVRYHTDILECRCVVCTSSNSDFRGQAFHCSQCGKTFCQKLMLEVHIKLNHSEKSSTKLYYCDKCPELYFISKQMKEAHCHQKHRRNLRSREADNSTLNDLADENDPLTHVIHIGQDEGKQFLPKLSEASMNAVIKELLVVERGSQNPYKCLLCNRSFSKSKYIKLHIRRAHVKDEDQPYRCKLCGSGFVRLTEFRKHSRSHSDFRPYKCRYCDKAFKQQANLRDHYRIHTMSKDYECYICKTKFRQRGGLTSHVVFHDTLKPFRCMYCEKGFTTRGELSRHMQKYDKKVGDQSVEKSYSCHICEKSYVHYPVLLKHIETHNPEKPFQCVVCEEKFANYVAMYFHKVREEHFLLQEVQAGLQEVQRKGRKFRVKKHLQTQGSQMKLDVSQDTVYGNQAGTYEGDPTNIQQVEVIIEEFNKENQQVIRVQENEPEHEELLSIAKQLTELSGCTEGEYYPNKTTDHQEEDEIIKTMLDADEEVLANFSTSKPTSGRPSLMGKYVTKVGQVNMHGGVENIQINVANESKGSSGTGREAWNSLVDEDHTEVAAESTGEEKIKENDLVSLVAHNTGKEETEQIVAYQNEDGSVIYVYLKDSTKDLQEVGEQGQSALENINEGAENVDDSEMEVEMSEEIVTEESDVNDSVVRVYDENAGYEARVEQFIQYENKSGPSAQAAEQPDEVKLTEISTSTYFSQQQGLETFGNQETAEIAYGHIPVTVQEIQSAMQSVSNVQNEQEVPITSAEYTDTNPTVYENRTEIVNTDFPETSLNNKVLVTTISDATSQDLRTSSGTVVSGEPTSQSGVFVNEKSTTDMSMGTRTSDSVCQIVAGSVTVKESESVNFQNVENRQSSTDTEPACEKIIIPSKTEENVIETQEELIKRSQLAQHLTGKIHSVNEPRRVRTLLVTRQGLKSINRDDIAKVVYAKPVVKAARSTVTSEENIVRSMAAVAEAASKIETRNIQDQDESANKTELSVSSEKSDEINVVNQSESFLGDGSLIECQGEEVAFIKEELSKEGYAEGNEKDQEVMFISDNIYTFIAAENKFMCLHCGSKVRTFKNLKAHIRRHAPETSKTHRCIYCPKRFITKHELKRHHWTHTGERNYVCKVCGKKYIQPGHLREHMRVHMGFKPFSCRTCHAKFTTKSQLELHWSRLHSNNQIPCNHCDKTFKNNVDLRRHKGLEHSEARQMFAKEKTRKEKDTGGDHICEICGESFSRLMLLKRHLEKHNLEDLRSPVEETRFKCLECGSSFKSKYYIQEHIKSKHSDEKNENCKECDASFKTKMELRKHRNSVHRNKKVTWDCELCNKKFGTKYALGYHMGAKHETTS